MKCVGFVKIELRKGCIVDGEFDDVRSNNEPEDEPEDHDDDDDCGDDFAD